jgi:adenylate cyclase, class 2
LVKLGAKDLGEVMLEEVIFYDPELKWREQNRFVRLRKKDGKIKLTYKQNQGQTIDSAEEIEFEVGDMAKAELLLEKVGLAAYRHQQKNRHTLELGEVTIDIDTWPRIPTYAELEGPSEDALKEFARKLELDWSTAVFDDARYIIEKRYNIPVSTMKWFTFDKFE